MHRKEIESLFAETSRRLKKCARRYFLSLAIKNSLQLLFYLLLGFVTVTVLELFLEFPHVLRYLFWVTGLLLGGYFFAKQIFSYLRKGLSPREPEILQIARLVEIREPQIGDAVLDFMDIYRSKGISGAASLRFFSLKQLYQKFADFSFESLISENPFRGFTRRFTIVLTVFVLLFILFPGAMNRAMLKILYPSRTFLEPPPIQLFNLTGDRTVLLNDPLELRGRYEGITPHKLWLVIQRTDKKDSPQTEKIEIPITNTADFSYKLNHVSQSFAFWFEAGLKIKNFKNRPIVSSTGHIWVKKRPFIRSLQVRIDYPAYTHLPSKLLSPNEGEITALKGSKVFIEIEASERLSRAQISFKDSVSIPMRLVENRAFGEFTIHEDNAYRVLIWNRDSISNFQPVEYNISVLSDEYPYVEIIKPGEDVELADNLQVPLLVNYKDDYGFSTAYLVGRVIRAGSTGDTSRFRQPLKIKYINKQTALSELNWNLTSFYLVPEDYIEYFVEIFDNDNISGPKKSTSRVYAIRLPSLVDILEQSEQSMNQNVEDTETLSRQSEELRKKLEEINREMKRENELTWERKQEIEEQLKKQDSTLKKLDEIQKKIEETIQQLDKQNLISPETLEKYMELQQMFQELASPELQKAMEKLKEALEKADMRQIRKAMEKFKFSVEQFEKSIERTYELFKQVQLEQYMDELVQMTQKLTDEQKEINRKLNSRNLKSEELEQLKNKEGYLEKQTRFLEDKIEKTQELHQELMGNRSEDLEKTQQYLTDQNIKGEMQEMQNLMAQQAPTDAANQGQQIEQQLEMLQSMMQNAKQNMTNQQKQKIMQAMQRVVQELLKTSFMEENLIRQSRKVDMASPKVNDIARKQEQIRENTTHIIQQMIDISKKTFFIPPQMNQLLSNLMQNYEKALRQLEERNPRTAAKAQQRAMSRLNQAVLTMQSAMQQMAKASSASGFQEFLKQLQQMSGQQGQLNQQTFSLFQQQMRGRLQLSEEDLARLAAQQEMIRQSLEKLNQQMGPRGDVLGRLNELGQEMEEVVKELKRKKLDRKVIERQEKILSRLLDAQKSIREREYSKKRQAERGKQYLVKSPPQLKKELLEKEFYLNKELMESLREGYSTEYEFFIKQYYEILSRQLNVPKNK